MSLTQSVEEHVTVLFKHEWRNLMQIMQHTAYDTEDSEAVSAY